MDNFDELKQTWLSASIDNLPDPGAMTRVIAAYRRKRKARIIGFLALVVVLILTMIWVVFDYHSHLITTRIGEACISVALLIILSQKVTALKRVQDIDTHSNETFLKYLKLEQVKLLEYQKKTQRLGFVVAGMGLLLYLYEGLSRTTESLIIGYGLTAVWLLFMWFIFRPLVMKRRMKKLNERIEQLEKLLGQLHE